MIGDEDLDAVGPVGGPFEPPVDYEIMNQGGFSLSWEVFPSHAGILVSNASGVLLPGESAFVTVSIDETIAGSLPAGVYVGSVTFRDRSDPTADVVRPASLTVQAVVSSGPTLTAVTPSFGPASGGNLVTLSGSGFMDGTPGTNVVMFGGKAATNVQLIDDTRLTCIVPDGDYGASVDVLYSNDDGSANRGNGYAYNERPTLISVYPSAGPASGGNTVTLSGAGFVSHQAGVNVVTFGGVQATNVQTSGDRIITCVVPPGLAGATVDVVVTNTNGVGGLPGAYAYQGSLSLTAVTPSSGPASGGNVVTLTGYGFQAGNPGQNTVTFGGNAAGGVVVVNDSTMRCTVPAGTPGQMVNVRVSNANGVALLPSGYGYEAAGVVLSDVSPSSGPAVGGGTVMLGGSGFMVGVTGPTTVTFGGAAATDVLVLSDSLARCTVPPGPAGVSVAVSLSNSSGSDSIANGYAYRAAPQLTAVIPSNGPATGGNIVRLNGSGFLDGDPGTNVVTFDGQPAIGVVVVSDVRIRCTAPAGTAGESADVAVSNANGLAVLQNAYAYNEEPTLTGVSPSRGPAAGGNQVTLSGTGFQNNNAGTNTVSFGSNVASNVVVVNDTTLRCDAPANTPGTTVYVAVANANGSDRLTGSYTYNAVPTLTGVSPSRGPAAGGTQVTLSGSGFQNNSPGTNAVTFGGNAATNIVVVSDTTLRCNAPAGSAGASVSVAVSNANGTAQLSGAYTYNAAPTLTGVSPANGPAAGGNQVTLSGSGFQANSPGSTSVTFGGSAATSVVLVNDTTLRCNAPAGSAGTSVTVAVSNANGTASLSGGYAYDSSGATVLPTTAFSSSGNEGGPFTPASAIYAITNTGTTNFSWSASTSDPFVYVDGTSSGVLLPGQSTNVTLRLAAITTNFPVGTYTATASFRDTATSTVFATRNVILNVQGPNGGWTVFTPSADTRMIYVSSSQGSDSNDGLSQATPKRTLSAGVALLRNGFPDWLLLRRGDTWTERFGVIRDRNGRSATERMLIGPYGPETDPRPLIRTGSSTGIELRGTCDYFAIVGLHFNAHTRTGADSGSIGVAFNSGGRNMLLEDCYVENYATNVVVWGDNFIRDFAMRRCVVVDAFSTGGHSQGMFTGDVGAPGIDGLLIEECLFDHNGWREGLSGAEQTVFNHNLYLNDIHVPGSTQRLVLRKNVIANASATGCQARGGGIVDRNIFVRNPVGLDWGIVTGGSDPLPGGVTGQVTGNVFLEGNDIGSSPRGGGINVGNVASGVISDNVLAHYASSQPFGIGMDITGDIGGEVDYGVHNLTVQDNLVYDWAQPLRWSSGVPGNEFQNIVVRGNNLQNPFIIGSSNGRPISHSSGGIPNAFTYDGNTYFSRNSLSDWFRVSGSTYSITGWVGLSGETNANALSSVSSFSDPDRSLGSYRDLIQSASGSSLTACLAELRQQRKGNWRPQYETLAIINYLRAGLDLQPLP